MMKEIWKNIKGYEGKYQVSNLGRVKSLGNDKFKKEKILRPGNNGKKKDGYLFVELCKNGIRKGHLVHRLVAQAFLENPDNLPDINHIDQDKQNNTISNLEWSSRKYNVRYSKAKKVGCFKDGKLIKVYNTTIDVTNDGFYQQSVCACCKGKQKHHHGFQWKYL